MIPTSSSHHNNKPNTTSGNTTQHNAKIHPPLPPPRSRTLTPSNSRPLYSHTAGQLSLSRPPGSATQPRHTTHSLTHSALAPQRGQTRFFFLFLPATLAPQCSMLNPPFYSTPPLVPACGATTTATTVTIVTTTTTTRPSTTAAAPKALRSFLHSLWMEHNTHNTHTNTNTNINTSASTHTPVPPLFRPLNRAKTRTR
ncbi:uncharacterized protein K452DRAFT_9996 [Aplosporella prunicola CBS 121167]|uniref:Uncharacterized protein n=1 Tax=Aplosporella prunicola CBS 121167 TaxID=1176127 RepID=A0A6A6BHC3_9PEZI|nr:uncharacterized protein K452DRAFT_9996 [Aplosporella prunicola CBS 121167]KAF2142725.1 hypothetical protein K452DRAFT_9996 [Aplosporella prunicola CBS 121167]